MVKGQNVELKRKIVVARSQNQWEHFRARLVANNSSCEPQWQLKQMRLDCKSDQTVPDVFSGKLETAPKNSLKMC